MIEKIDEMKVLRTFFLLHALYVVDIVCMSIGFVRFTNPNKTPSRRGGEEIWMSDRASLGAGLMMTSLCTHRCTHRPETRL
jgi:hypothetical protein